MGDILILKKRGCQLIDPLYDSLYRFWKQTHGSKSHLSLARTKQDFFDDFVPHKYDHDYLHTVVAYNPGIPLFTRCLKDGQEVLLDRAKFETFSFEDKVRLFREEMYVIALERFLIPTQFKMPVGEAFIKARKKTLTNLTKNWAAKFIITNYDAFTQLESKHWVQNFLTKHGEEYPKMTDTQELENLKNELREMFTNAGPYDEREVLLHGEITTDRNSKYFTETDRALLDDFGFESIKTVGGESQGDTYYHVFKLRGKLYRLDGWYQSYGGTDCDDVYGFYEVKAQEKTITVYE